MKKRSVTIAGHATSITLEDEFWAELTRIAASLGLTINALVTQVDAGRSPESNLSSALRVFILKKVTGQI